MAEFALSQKWKLKMPRAGVVPVLLRILAADEAHDVQTLLMHVLLNLSTYPPNQVLLVQEGLEVILYHAMCGQHTGTVTPLSEFAQCTLQNCRRSKANLNLLYQAELEHKPQKIAVNPPKQPKKSPTQKRDGQAAHKSQRSEQQNKSMSSYDALFAKLDDWEFEQSSEQDARRGEKIRQRRNKNPARRKISPSKLLKPLEQKSPGKKSPQSGGKKVSPKKRSPKKRDLPHSNLGLSTPLAALWESDEKKAIKNKRLHQEGLPKKLTR
jgi:hypothetical protein